MNLMTYETYEYLCDFWVTWGVSCAFVNAEDVPAMYEQSEPNGPNGGSEALQLRICDSKSFVALWLAGSLMERLTSSENLRYRALGNLATDLSCLVLKLLKAHTKITVSATTLTNQQILASWSASASRPMVKRLSLLRVIWCRENIKGGTGKNNIAKIQYNDWILDLL